MEGAAAGAPSAALCVDSHRRRLQAELLSLGPVHPPSGAAGFRGARASAIRNPGGVPRRPRSAQGRRADAGLKVVGGAPRSAAVAAAQAAMAAARRDWPAAPAPAPAAARVSARGAGGQQRPRSAHAALRQAPRPRQSGVRNSLTLPRPVTPQLAAPRRGQAHAAARRAWARSQPRPRSADSQVSRRSARIQPDSLMFIRSNEWEPTMQQPAASPQPGPPKRAQPTGRVFVAASTEQRRAEDLAAIRDSTAEAPQLLCPKHQALAASDADSLEYLYCQDCFALTLASKQQQATEEAASHTTKTATENDDAVIRVPTGELDGVG